jgi:hypothetical protein
VPADLLEALDAIGGRWPLGDILDDTAVGPPRGTPRPALRAQALPVSLDLYERGSLEPQE